MLSNYRPVNFANKTITLTVDGGQHLMGPGEAAPPITRKEIQDIFMDPVFEHRQALKKFDG